MNDGLRLLRMIFTAPLTGLREVRDRAPLLPAWGLAWGANLAYFFYTQWHYWLAAQGRPTLWDLLRAAAQFTTPLLLLAFVLAPVTAFLAYWLSKRGTLRAFMREDYTALLACLLYAWAAVCLWALPLAALEQVTGWRAQVMSEAMRMVAEKSVTMPPELNPADLPRMFSMYLGFLTLFPFFIGWFLLVVRQMFSGLKTSWRGLAAGSLILGLLFSLIALPLFWAATGVPFIILLLFIVLRGYFSSLAHNAQGQANFQRHLEISTLNPADASAHYNLGLIHLRRNQLAEAQARFTQALRIDDEEIDAHYQMGRIARAEGRWAEAIGHFTAVVSRDETHAQHEIWRETGATYLAAGQYTDARAMLERFLTERAADPQGLYLLGRAQSGLGDNAAARVALEACIAAVKNTPNFKYPAEKRWLKEAQQFLRSL